MVTVRFDMLFITQKDHMRKVTQFHMTNWTDEGVCTNPPAIMKIIEELFLIQRRTGNKPVVIHGW